MPNTAVKPANAESTWGEAPWEDRKPLILIKKALAYASAFLWFVVCDSWLVGNEFVVRRGRPKGRPAVIFDHSPFWYYGEPFFGLRCSFAATDS